MGCPTTLADFTQIFGLFQWTFLTVALYLASFNLAWSQKWWGYVSKKTSTTPREKIITPGMAALAAANSFAVWRLWYCNNWDVDCVPLFIYLAMVVINALWAPFINKLNDATPSLVVALISVGLGVAFVVFAAIANDFWVIFIAVIDCIVFLAQAIISAQMFTTPNLYSGYNTSMSKIESREDKMAADAAKMASIPQEPTAYHMGAKKRNHKPVAINMKPLPGRT